MPRIGSNYNIFLAQQFMTENRLRYAKTLEPVASGLRINRPSDDPARLSEYFANLSTQEKLGQYTINISTARSKATLTDLKLSEVSDKLSEAYTLALAGNNQASSPSDVSAVLDRLETIKEDILRVANSKNGNEYVFSGYKTDTEPFSSEPVVYNGDHNLQFIRIGDNQNVQVSIDADQAFLGGGTGIDIFDTIDQVRDAISNNDTLALGQLITDLQESVEQITIARSTLGNSLTSLDNAEQSLQNLKIQSAERIAYIADVDMAEATTQLSAQEYALKASLAVTQRVMEIQLQSFFG